MSRDAPLLTVEDVLMYLRFIRTKRQEYFVCLSMDSEHVLIARRTVTIGLVDTALVHPREVFAGPLKDRAASVIIAHNHPSGTISPSRQDAKATSQLAAAGELLGIPVYDHVIVSKGGYFSFRQNGLLKNKTKFHISH